MEWFILPCLLELAGIGFLIATIVVSKHCKAHLWKSSLYALLYHGLEHSALDKYPIPDTVSGMEQKAKSLAVHLEMSQDEDRVLLKS